MQQINCVEFFFGDMWKKMQIFMKNKLLVGGAGGRYEILWVRLK